MNTRPYTELCLRSMRRHAGAPFELVVGDVASTDGSAEMLRRMARGGQLRLQEAPYPRYHGQWIDQWRAECDSEVLVVVDSDIEFVGQRWLPRLMAALEGYAMVAYRAIPAGTYTERRPTLPGGEPNPLYPHTLTLLARPDPCVLALDHVRTRHLRTSFTWQPEEGDWPPRRAWDTAGAFARSLEAEGLRWRALTEEERAMFVHFEARTTGLRSTRLRTSVRVRAKLWRLRCLEALGQPDSLR
jgi:hypothetical protein